MNRKSAILLSGAALFVVGAVALSARARTRTSVNPAANNPGPAPVNVAKARAVKSAPREEITGSLQPARSLQLGFEVGGRVAHILVRKGERVSQGQVLARLDAELADAQVLQAEAGVKAAGAQFAIAADTARRHGNLQRDGNVSEWQGHTSAAQADAAEAQLQSARAQLAQARAARRRHELKAPFAGVVIDAPDQIGATVGPGTPLFTLEQLDPLILRLTVGESARAALSVGARLHVEAVAGTVSADDAFIRAVIPSADPATRRIPAELVVPNRDGRFVAHTLARAVLPLGEAKDAIALPASALASQGGDHVFAVDGGEVQRVPVDVIDRGAQQVVVVAARALEAVVDYPAPDLKDGARVSFRSLP